MLLLQIQSDLKQALLSRDELKVSALRMLLSSIHNEEIAFKGKGKEIVEDDIINIVRREIKKRDESIQFFESGGRIEMANKEKKEKDILKNYLPAEMPDDELLKIIKDEIAKLTNPGIGDVIKNTSVRSGNAADKSRIAKFAKELLGN